MRRRFLLGFWRLVNPVVRPLAGWAPWWVLLETTGRRTGTPRVVPLAAGPVEGDGMWLAAVHGRRAAWVLNLEARSRVRVRRLGRWHEGTATVHPWDPDVVGRFNAYARTGPRLTALDPLLVRVAFTRTAEQPAEEAVP